MTSLRSVFLLAVSLLLFAAQSESQVIPNGDFETWIGDSVLVGWTSANSALARVITKATPAHSGNFAVQGTAAAFGTPPFSFPLPPTLFSGVDGVGIPIATRPAAFTGWYKFVPMAGSADVFFVDVVLYKGGISGTAVAVAATISRTAVSSFTQFSIPFQYVSNLVPDTAFIEFTIVDTSSTATVVPGSFYVLDDIAFSGTNSVASEPGTPFTYSLSQNYPNPFNPSTMIPFTLAKTGHATLEVYDILGQEVMRLVDGELTAGPHEIRFDGSRLSSGFYMYRIESGGFVETRRMVLLK
jgi:hypothetical protein